jgi:membrane protein implicated in regulation of membrane protease activity
MFGLAPPYVWLIAGALLMMTEMIAPGFFLIWIGGAALLTGAAAIALGLGTTVQFILFAVAAVALVLGARTYLPYHAGQSPEPLMNQRATRLIGQTVEVTEAITAVSGRVKVGDGMWNAKGCDAATGAQVKITGADGNTLIVEKA